MSKQLVKLRQRAAANQNNHCYYCNATMCIDVNLIKDFAKLHNISVKQAKWLTCTAEHLFAKQDGGKDTQKNIVAACLFCNKKRHARKKYYDPIEFKDYVIKRVRKKRWNLLVQKSY